MVDPNAVQHPAPQPIQHQRMRLFKHVLPLHASPISVETSKIAGTQAADRRLPVRQPIVLLVQKIVQRINSSFKSATACPALRQSPSPPAQPRQQPFSTSLSLCAPESSAGHKLRRRQPPNDAAGNSACPTSPSPRPRQNHGRTAAPLVAAAPALTWKLLPCDHRIPPLQHLPYWSAAPEPALVLSRSSYGCQSISKNDAYRCPFSSTSHRPVFLAQRHVVGHYVKTAQVLLARRLQNRSCASAPPNSIFTACGHTSYPCMLPDGLQVWRAITCDTQLAQIHATLAASSKLNRDAVAAGRSKSEFFA